MKSDISDSESESLEKDFFKSVKIVGGLCGWLSNFSFLLRVLPIALVRFVGVIVKRYFISIFL